jgi:hypothetical protein
MAANHIGDTIRTSLHGEGLFVRQVRDPNVRRGAFGGVLFGIPWRDKCDQESGSKQELLYLILLESFLERTSIALHDPVGSFAVTINVYEIARNIVVVPLGANSMSVTIGTHQQDSFGHHSTVTGSNYFFDV